MVVVVMGVSGSGKTTLGTMLSGATGWAFLDADDFHSAANKTKMASGKPLTDEDRAPWLAQLHEEIARAVHAGEGMVLACSALRESYRTILRQGLPEGSVRFALLDAPKEVLTAHVAGRTHAYMNPTLLASQIATLETPKDAWIIPVDRRPEESLKILEGYLREAGAIA